MTTSKIIYKRVFSIVRFFGRIVMPQRNIGVENIPEGACIVCANHSNAVDPVLIALAFGEDRFMHFLAKDEARKIPVINGILNKIESIFIRRGERDLRAIKQCMKYLKAGEKILLFPEGTRVRGDCQVVPKTGAIHLAEKTQVPLLPCFLPRDKKFGKRTVVVIGEPYYVDISEHADYQVLADDLMRRIYALKEKI